MLKREKLPVLLEDSPKLFPLISIHDYKLVRIIFLLLLEEVKTVRVGKWTGTH